MVLVNVSAGMTLLTCCVVVSSSSLTRHSPVRGTQCLSRMVWALSLTVTCNYVNLTSHPLSQRKTTEISGFLNSRKMWLMCAFDGSLVSRSSH
jgi:hypothetical protein